MPKQLKQLSILLSLSLLMTFVASLLTKTQAQTTDNFSSLGIAVNIEVVGENLESGNVITHTEGQYRLTAVAYDPNTYGVINLAPAVEFTYTNETTLENTVPVITKGTLPVKVTALNGSISVGDRLATSSVEGIAMLSNKSGFTIGIAQEAFDPANPEETGEILTTLDIRYTVSGDISDTSKVQNMLKNVFNLSAIAAFEEPTVVLKYVLAAFILIGSMAFSFLAFGRSAQNSILALGRNPLASRAISIGMVLNVMISIVVVIGGVATAWFVINL